MSKQAGVQAAASSMSPHVNRERCRDGFSDMARVALVERSRQERYFHDFDFGDLRTGSWVYGPDLPPNYHLWPVFQYISELELEGRTCLDIGTYDGMTAFVLAKCDAGLVRATCQSDLARFRIARALSGCDNVEYYPEYDLETTRHRFADASHDVVVMSAMLHHLTAPLDALLEARRLLNTGGILILESITREGGGAVLSLNTALDDPVFGVPTIWIPDERTLTAMLRLACFEPVSKTRLVGGRNARETNYDRVTYLARAEQPSRITNRTSKTSEFHRTLSKIGHLEIDRLEREAVRSDVLYSGPKGDRHLNIWLDSVSVPFQPQWSNPRPAFQTCFRLATDEDFRTLVERWPSGSFQPEDIQLLAARYPGEIMPEGMTWSLKQLGNLFVLDQIAKWGMTNVLEIGPGFNLYFPNHLKEDIGYAAIDSAGFYEPEILALTRKIRKRGTFYEGLVGGQRDPITPGSFDCCFSVSVLEHVPKADIPAACRDMYTLLRPGGWCIHSIDLMVAQLGQLGNAWLSELQKAGFLLDESSIDLRLDLPRSAGAEIFTEANSISMRFYGGYVKNIWNSGTPVKAVPRYHTVLVAVRKPI
jgi:SAM-dependent methyltransferase